MKNKLLLIIDPQIDFISGSLPVPGAGSAMNGLAGYIRLYGRDYEYFIVTADRHPVNHCSFTPNGGKWPRHCVADSVGAAIWPPIMNALSEHTEKLIFLHKGENTGREEYSIFKNQYATHKILEVIDHACIRQIDICGIAGDVCVADTIRDGIDVMKEMHLNVLTEFAPSSDGGRVLYSLISKYGLSCGR